MKLLNTKTLLWFLISAIASISLPIINTGQTQTIQSIALYFALTGVTCMFYLVWNSEDTSKIKNSILLHSYLISSSILLFVLFFQEVFFLNSELLSFSVVLTFIFLWINSIIVLKKYFMLNFEQKRKLNWEFSFFYHYINCLFSFTICL